MLNLNHNARLLIAIHTIHSVIELFINTFLVAYFLNLTGNNIIPAAMFYIFTYGMLSLFFPLLGPFVKCGNKLAAYRLSFLINAVMLLLIIWLKQNVTSYIWILGSFLGLEKALFYFPQNLLSSQEAGGAVIVRFHGYRSALAGAAKIIMPVIFGWFISVDSFINTAAFVLLLTAAELVLSFFITGRASYHKPFCIKALLALMLKRSKIKSALVIDFINGFIFDILDVLVVLYVVYMFKTNLNLGIFTSVFAVLTVLSNAFFGRFCRYGSFSIFLSFCSLLTFSGAAYFVFDTTEVSFVIYNLTFSSAAQLIRTMTSINAFKVSQDKSVASLYRAEYLALREIFLNLGRIFGFFLVIIAVWSHRPDMLKYLILSLSIMIVFMGYLSVNLSRCLCEKEKDKC